MNKLLASGIWMQPIMMACIIKFLRVYRPRSLLSGDTWWLCVFVSFLPVLFLVADNLSKPSSERALTGKQSAMYPEIPKELLYKVPKGIVMGKDKRTKKYVCKDLQEDGHVFLIGGSGSGKSSCSVIPTLLANQATSIFAVDIKGELSFKSTKYGNEHVLIFNPSDRNKYGYDPFYNLNENSSAQTILEVMQNISYSLIAMPADLRDPFWKNSARNLLLGLLIFYYKQGIVDFVEIIDEILGKPIKDSIQEVMEKANPKSAEYRFIVQFSSMETETLGGIVGEMNNHIVIFSNDQNIRYAFKNNGCKLNPHKLEEGYSIYLSIHEEKLSAYYDVLQLIINQTLAELEKRPEDSEPVIFVIDELPRILSAGKLDRLLDGARTLRSRRVCLFLITQSTEALMSAFTENEVADLISNCPYIIVMSASSSKTQKMVCDWCGKYRIRKQSWSGSGKDMRISTNYDEKNIVEQSDLLTLKSTGEAILVTPFGYSRVKKVAWYEDKILKPKAMEIIKYNEAIKEASTGEKRNDKTKEN